MKFICLGYIEEGKFEALSERERNAMVDECFSYDDVLRKNGHFAGGEALQPPDNAKTLWWKDGKAVPIDGPYAETKEQIGGILLLEARDMGHAVELMSKHPGVKAGPFEIRPAADLTEMIRESDRRRGKEASTAQAIPQGFHTLTPSFTFKDSRKAIEFYKKAFSAKVLDLFPNPNGAGTMHATLQIGNSILMMGDENPGQGCKSAETAGVSPISLYLYLPNADEAFQQALAAGAEVVMPVAEMFWGDRAGMIKDPFGYSWMIATHTRDLSNEEIRKGAEDFFARMAKK